MITTGPSPLWYLTRGTGLVSLVLLTASVGLGIVQVGRWSSPHWPRFVTLGLHRNISLIVLIVLAVHILTAELDPFAPLGWLAIAVPFASSYRPVWLGMGTLAFDLLVALVLTSLLRPHLGYRAWKTVHWASYVSWPLAVVHGLGTGTDPRLDWVKWLTVACTAAVVVAGGWRLASGWPSERGLRGAVGAASVVSIAVATAWAMSGPLRPGWARRAGTPAQLLATARAPLPNAPSGPAPTSTRGESALLPRTTTLRPTTTTPVPSTTPGPKTARVVPALPSTNSAPVPSATTVPRAGHTSVGTVPAPPFTGQLLGTLSRARTFAGQVIIAIHARVSGALQGLLQIRLRGDPAGRGVALQSGSVTMGPVGAPGQFRGQVVSLDGQAVGAIVSSTAGEVLELHVELRIDPASGVVRGRLRAIAGGGSASSADTDDAPDAEALR